MTTVSMLYFRRNAEKVIHRIRRGQQMLLTYRGKPVMRLAPIHQQTIADDDPFYLLGKLSQGKGENLTNSEIDDIVYGV